MIALRPSKLTSHKVGRGMCCRTRSTCTSSWSICQVCSPLPIPRNRTSRIGLFFRGSGKGISAKLDEGVVSDARLNFDMGGYG